MPAAILFVATFSIGSGLFGLAWGLVLAGAGGLSWLAGLVSAETVRAWGANALWVGLGAIGTGLLQLVAGFGLLARQR